MPKNNFNAYMPSPFRENPHLFVEETKPPKQENPDYFPLDDVDVSKIDKTRKLIAFTFDDAPAKSIENILAVFAAYNEQNPDCIASATFFVNGYLVDAHSIHSLYTANMMGFELGNHTQNHCNLITLNEDELQAEIDKTDEILFKIDAKKRHLLRAPFGSINNFVKEHAPTPLIDWTIDTLDWTGVGAETIQEHIFSHRFPGAIVLMHDGYPATVEALKNLLPMLKEDGYQVVSVSALAKMHGCTLRNGNVYIRLRNQKQ